MPVFDHSYTSIASKIQDELLLNTSLTRMTPGGKARALIDAVARQTKDTLSLFDREFTQAFLSKATGKHLEYLGDLLGVTKLRQSLAFADVVAKAVRFYVSDPEKDTFGEINSGTDISITEGTLISPSIDSRLFFRVSEATTLTAALTEAFVSVEALTPGSLANVGTDSLKYHNFTNYTDVLNGSLRVTNAAPILNGQDEETESNYKFRISKAL